MSVVIAKERRMGWALFLSSALSEPLFTLYGLVGIILYKNLEASAWQIALMTMLKPVISLLSVYWSAGLGRSGKVKSNVLWGGFLMRAPFLLCPWIDSVWFIIAASVNYMLFHRAVIPGWMEILKRNMGEGKRGRAFSLSSAFGYVEGVALSLGAGALLDHQPGMWKILFCVAALIGMGVLLIQARLSVEGEEERKETPSVSLREFLVRPWKNAWELMREKPDFSRYQWGFMVCGFGIMLIQPALPIFAVDNLGVSYTMAAAGISLAKGLGFAVSSPLWAKWIERVNVLRLAGWVFLSVAIFPILMASSVFWIGWFFLAYFWYGVGQGGSHLVWHMAGPIFAGKEESSKYTSVGLIMGGLRGAVAPPLGSFLTVSFGAIEVLVLGGLLSFYSGAYLLRRRISQVLQKN